MKEDRIREPIPIILRRRKKEFSFGYWVLGRIVVALHHIVSWGVKKSFGKRGTKTKSEAKTPPRVIPDKTESRHTRRHKGQAKRRTAQNRQNKILIDRQT